jgi:hypothetical protein
MKRRSDDRANELIAALESWLFARSSPTGDPRHIEMTKTRLRDAIKDFVKSQGGQVEDGSR